MSRCRSRSRTPPPVWDAWRDDPDVQWIGVVVRTADLPAADGDFRTFDRAAWEALGSDTRYRYEICTGVFGEECLYMRAMPDYEHTVEDLKRFIVRNIVEASALRDIKEASCIEGYMLPKIYIKQYYSVEAAIHQRVVRVRSVEGRKNREPPQRNRPAFQPRQEGGGAK